MTVCANEARRCDRTPTPNSSRSYNFGAITYGTAQRAITRKISRIIVPSYQGGDLCPALNTTKVENTA